MKLSRRTFLRAAGVSLALPWLQSTALGAAAMLEVGLSSALRTRMWIKDDKADVGLFGERGPLSAFSNKIKIAEAMRIIGPATRANLERIRQIRNAFAHTSRNLRFDNPGIIAICDRITFDVWPSRPRMPPIGSSRDRYVFYALGLFVVFEEVAKHTRSGESVPWDNYPVQYWWGEKYPAPLP